VAEGSLAAWRPAVVIASIYVAQGLVAFVGLVMLVVLAQLGMPLEDQVGLLASGALPWVLKFLFGLILDLRPSWPLKVRSLVLLTLLAAATASTWQVSRSWASSVEDSLLALGLAWLALNFAMAVVDTLVDALALDVLPEHRALAATGMSLGHTVGYGLLGALWFYPAVAAHAAELGIEGGLAAGLELVVFALALIGLTPVLLWAPGRPGMAWERPSARAERTPDDWRWLLTVPLLAMLTMLAPGITDALGQEFVINVAGWDQADFMARVVPIGVIAGLIGALSAGPLVARFGPVWTSAGAALLLGVSTLIFAGLSAHWTDLWPNLVMAVPEGFLQPALLVGLHALALLAAARSPLPVTGFVLMMAALNLPRVIGALLGPKVLELGWVGMFTVCGAVLILAAVALPPLLGRANGSGDLPPRGVH
jgi:hypothetical protein